MRNKFIIIGFFTIAMVIFASSLFAEESPTLFWYRIKILEGENTYTYVGSSTLNEEEFIAKLKKDDFIILSNLVYYDQMGKIKSLSEWDPTMKSKVYLNPKYIVSVIPLTGDPRKVVSQ